MQNSSFVTDHTNASSASTIPHPLVSDHSVGPISSRIYCAGFLPIVGPTHLPTSSCIDFPPAHTDHCVPARQKSHDATSLLINPSADGLQANGMLAGELGE
ncbi:hypothetical protein DPSP01_004673 [Paraphaeosphaeria sporulosa]